MLDQASLGFSGTSPNVTLKTFKLSALIGKGTWDLYLYNTVPTLTISAQDSANALANDILNQLGGLFNVALSKTGYFANGGDFKNRDIKGGQLDFRLGGKVLDAHNGLTGTRGSIRNMVPILQSTLDFRYMIPLVDPLKKRQGLVSDIKKNMLGNLSFRVYGSVMQVLNSKVYDRYYSTREGVPPKLTLITGNAEFNLFISNQFYISAGYTVSNQQETLPNRSFFSISYSGN